MRGHKSLALFCLDCWVSWFCYVFLFLFYVFIKWNWVLFGWFEVVLTPPSCHSFLHTKFHLMSFYFFFLVYLRCSCKSFAFTWARVWTVWRFSISIWIFHCSKDTQNWCNLGTFVNAVKAKTNTHRAHTHTQRISKWLAAI